MKFSQYNIEIEKDEQFVVIYNTYKGAADGNVSSPLYSPWKTF